MNPNDKNQSGQRQEQKQQGGIPGDRDPQRSSDRSEADERARRGERGRDDGERVIPELDEPDVDGVGKEGRDTPGSPTPDTDLDR